VNSPRAWVRLAVLLALACGGDAIAFDLQGHRGARGVAPENKHVPTLRWTAGLRLQDHGGSVRDAMARRVLALPQ